MTFIIYVNMFQAEWTVFNANSIEEVNELVTAHLRAGFKEITIERNT